MNTMTFSRLKQLGVKVKNYLPATVTVDGAPVFVISNEKDVIVIKDMHIRVRNQLRALYKKARVGMPKDTKITEDTE